jgi:hypothetical protein
MSKGDRRERQAVDLLQRGGFATYRPATVKFGENDVFGLFDILAVKPDHGAVKAIQVKSNRATGINAWARHTALFRSLGWETEYWVPEDMMGWRIIECFGADSHVQSYDERSHPCDMGEGVVKLLRRYD